MRKLTQRERFIAKRAALIVARPAMIPAPFCQLNRKMQFTRNNACNGRVEFCNGWTSPYHKSGRPLGAPVVKPDTHVYRPFPELTHVDTASERATRSRAELLTAQIKAEGKRASQWERDMVTGKLIEEAKRSK